MFRPLIVVVDDVLDDDDDDVGRDSSVGIATRYGLEGWMEYRGS